jgi:hypothetical protein
MQVRITYTLRVVITLLLLLPASATPQSGLEALHKFFAEFFEERLSDQPEFATTKRFSRCCFAQWSPASGVVARAGAGIHQHDRRDVGRGPRGSGSDRVCAHEK